MLRSNEKAPRGAFTTDHAIRSRASGHRRAARSTTHILDDLACMRARQAKDSHAQQVGRGRQLRRPQTQFVKKALVPRAASLRISCNLFKRAHRRDSAVRGIMPERDRKRLFPCHPSSLTPNARPNTASAAAASITRPTGLRHAKPWLARKP
jgi:hypothetical protein